MYNDGKLSDEINNAIVSNYELLAENGLLEYIEKLNHTIVNKNELLYEAAEIFNKRSVLELVNYITDKFLNKFVPYTLTFVIQNDINPDVPEIITYMNMKQIENSISIENFGLYKKFFSLSPTSISFDAFRVMMDNKSDTEVFCDLMPELIVPMMGLDGVYGFIIFGKKADTTFFEDSEIHFIDEIMKFISISLQNIIHYNRAITDMKTRLFNHDYFIQSFIRELNRIKRYGNECGLLMIDIDHFKKINDTYGHVAGDEVIKSIATIITETIRKEDIPARFGGEEFVILLIECRNEYLFEVAERIRKKIENSRIAFEKTEIKTTISIGLLHIS
ncbi:MAG TPA: GGDEF domain-containing protein, partial [Spirochaetota bacterium]|nr:GGDEF domain-containing protein [Spirochaetota bacterium]